MVPRNTTTTRSCKPCNTITGCTVQGESLDLVFNSTLLAGAAVTVLPYNTSAVPPLSALSVVVNSTDDSGTNGTWVAVHIAAVRAAHSPLLG
jgi:hypothetical protein